MRKKVITIIGLFLFIIAFVACNDDDNGTEPVNSGNSTEVEEEDMSGFAKGADVGWLTEMESNDYAFYNADGEETECMSLMKNLGMNSIRLRVWVNPTDGWCNKSDLLVKAKRANDLNMRIMVDFHYSDEWADPDDQHKPTAWEDFTLSELCEAVSDYTTDVLTTLSDWGITPEWVQIGNETIYGMMWNDDDYYAENSGYLYANNGANYSKLNNAGYDAAKAVFPDTKVVIHIDRGYKNSLTSSFLSYIIDNDNDCEDAEFDVLGLSLYPDSTNYEELDSLCLINMQWVVDNYDKDVMLCEVGMNYAATQASKAFLSDIISKTESVTDGDGNVRGLGVFYWEPESYGDWEGYTMGAFDDNGYPTEALDAFGD